MLPDALNNKGLHDFAALLAGAEDADGDRYVGGIAMSAGRIVHALHAVADAPNRIITAMDIPLVPGTGLLK